jgi:hypothetical protein
LTKVGFFEETSAGRHGTWSDRSGFRTMETAAIYSTSNTHPSFSSMPNWGGAVA